MGVLDPSLFGLESLGELEFSGLLRNLRSYSCMCRSTVWNKMNSSVIERPHDSLVIIEL